MLGHTLLRIYFSILGMIWLENFLIYIGEFKNELCGDWPRLGFNSETIVSYTNSNKKSITLYLLLNNACYDLIRINEHRFPKLEHVKIIPSNKTVGFIRSNKLLERREIGIERTKMTKIPSWYLLYRVGNLAMQRMCGCYSRWQVSPFL